MGSNPAYMREWRKTEVGKAAVKDQKRKEKARRTAYALLAARHQVEFQTLYNAALAALVDV
jgi:hypothetical protein